MRKIKEEKQAKFFCESCGAEVKPNARVCTYCGKFFSSVRCPRCGMTGNTQDFKSGCPSCGYAVIPGKNFYGNGKNSGSLNGSSNKNIFSKIFLNKNKTTNSESLPFWIYAVCITVLALCVGGIYSCL